MIAHADRGAGGEGAPISLTTSDKSTLERLFLMNLKLSSLSQTSNHKVTARKNHSTLTATVMILLRLLFAGETNAEN